MERSRHFDYTIGQRVDGKWRNRKVNFTLLMQEALPIMRGALVSSALNRRTITYKDLSITIDERYHYRQLGLALYYGERITGN